jgi:glutaredoxin-like protein NrdH
MPPIKMYSLSTCGHCRHTKQYFSENGIPYDYVDVDLLQGQERTETIEKVKTYNPNCSFPTILIGNRVVVGFRENEIKEALGHE